MSCIYVIENTSNNKKYIGQTCNWVKRKSCHRRKLQRNKHYNQHLQRAWNEHGEDAFVFKVLVSGLPDHYVDVMERGLIATLRSTDPKYGYNRDGGGKLNKTVSEETRKKQSNSQLRLYAEGYIHPSIGKKHSPELREKNSQAQLKWYADGGVPSWKGKSLPEETKKKIRQASLKQFKNGNFNSASPIIGPDGFIYPSIKIVVQCLGININGLTSALHKNRPYKGMTFSYLSPKYRKATK